MARLRASLRSADGPRARRGPTPLPKPNLALLGLGSRGPRANLHSSPRPRAVDPAASGVDFGGARANPSPRPLQTFPEPAWADAAPRPRPTFPEPASGPAWADAANSATTALDRELAAYEGTLRGARSTRPPWLRKPHTSPRWTRLLVYVLVACAAFVSAAEQLPSPGAPPAGAPMQQPTGSAGAQPAAAAPQEQAPATPAPVRARRVAKRPTKRARAARLAARVKRKQKHSTMAKRHPLSRARR